jgi:acyl transferase domain-containing protein
MGRTVVTDEGCRWLPSLSKRREDCDQVLRRRCALYERCGCGLAASIVPGAPEGRCPPIHFSGAGSGRGSQTSNQDAPAGGHPLLGRRVVRRSSLRILQAEVAMDSPAFLQEHRIFDKVIVPGAAYVEMGLSAAAAVCGDDLYSVDNLSVLSPLALPDGERRIVQTIVSGADDPNGLMTFEIHSSNATPSGVTRNWTLHASGELRRTSDAEPAAVELRVRGEWESRCAERVDGRDYYERLRESGVDYGSAFRRIEDVLRRDGEVVARLSVPEAQPDTVLLSVQPALLDASFQALGLAIQVLTTPSGTSTCRSAWNASPCEAPPQARSGATVCCDLQGTTAVT